MTTLERWCTAALRVLGVYFILRSIPALAQLGALVGLHRVLDDVAMRQGLGESVSSSMYAAWTASAVGAALYVIIGIWLVVRARRLTTALLRDVDAESTDVQVHSGTATAIVAVAGVVLAATGVPVLFRAAAELTPIAGDSLANSLTGLFRSDWVYFFGMILQVVLGGVMAIRARWVVARLGLDG